MREKFGSHFEVMDKHISSIQKETEQTTKRMADYDKTFEEQNKRMKFMSLQLNCNQKRGFSDAASNASWATTRSTTRPRNDEKDPEKLVVGEWKEDTSVNTMKSDLEKFLVNFKEATSLCFRIEAIFAQEGFGKYCSVKLDDEKGVHDRRQTALLVSDWFAKQKRKQGVQFLTFGGLGFWIAVHRPTEERDGGAIINCALRVLHLYRDANTIPETYKAYPTDKDPTKMVLGKFKQLIKGARWASTIVAVLNEEDGTMQGKPEVLNAATPRGSQTLHREGRRGEEVKEVLTGTIQAETETCIILGNSSGGGACHRMG
eukprot:TRINITY_DN28902_c0_g1_i1.p1 TRINITY_DN28902_c0_g1~~TRINITY_DN28902_c0_g1_i1.p1  ORF type:complete len:316 (-),score=50.71 TRINITY_DN28902_c0_g1_i1:43-990(-)